MQRLQAVVFDLDDTLFPERDFVLSGFRAVSEWADARFGVPAAEVYGALEGYFESGVRGDTFTRWLASQRLPGEEAAEMVAVYRGHQPRIRPFPGVPELLERLAGRVKLGLVSDGWHAVQRAKLHALGIGHWFGAVVFSDEMGRDCWKPSEVPFRRVLGELGSAPAASVYVGDNCTKDFVGARSLGMHTVWARHGGGDHAHGEPASPLHAAEHTTATLHELASLLLCASFPINETASR